MSQNASQVLPGVWGGWSHTKAASVNSDHSMSLSAPQPQGYVRPEPPPVKDNHPEAKCIAEAQLLGYICPPGSQCEHLAGIMGVRWDSHLPLPEDPKAAKMQIDRVWGKNYRRVYKQIQSESKDGRQQDEVAGFIRVELERVATSKGIPDEAIAAYSLEQLRSAVFAVGEAPVALGVGAAELPVLREVDIAMLGMQPLGASYVVPGKALLSVEQRADVDDRRAAHKDRCFSKHLDMLDSVQWALCTTCQESKLAAKPYTFRKGTQQLWCKRCLARTSSKDISKVHPYMHWAKENLVHFSPVPPERNNYLGTLSSPSTHYLFLTY